MTDYLDPADVRPDEPTPEPVADTSHAATEASVDLRMLHLCGQQLLAAREAIDATLLTLGMALGEDAPHPAPLSVCDTEELECDHPRDRRQMLKTIGDTGDAEWLCRECGYQHTK